MEVVELRDGMWVDFEHEGKLLRGKLARKWDKFPISESNFCIKVGGAYYQPVLESIVKVYPKFVFPYNPTERQENGSLQTP